MPIIPSGILYALLYQGSGNQFLVARSAWSLRRGILVGGRGPTEEGSKNFQGKLSKIKAEGLSPATTTKNSCAQERDKALGEQETYPWLNRSTNLPRECKKTQHKRTLQAPIFTSRASQATFRSRQVVCPNHHEPLPGMYPI